MRHCGGCDWFFIPEWSPSGRFLVLPEILDGGLVYLADVQDETISVISDVPRPTGRYQRPDWSPVADRLLRPGPEGSTILEDLDAGTSRQLDDLPWPAAFDPTGTYANSPAWWTGPSNDSGPIPPAMTTIADGVTGEVVATRAGAPPWERIWDEPSDPIVAIDGGFVAALPNSEECDGTLVYDPGDDNGACLQGAVAATFSQNTRLVAFARETGRTGPTTGAPYLESSGGLPTWEVAIFDRITGDTTVVAEDAFGSYFPDLTWNEDGTHLLIRWPNAFGL